MAAAIPYVLLAISAAGAVTSYQAQKKAGRDEQAARNMKADALEEQAGRVERRGDFEEEQARLRLKKLMASQRTLYAKAGVDLSSGSPITVLAATAGQGAEEIEMIRQNTAEEAEAVRTGVGLERFYGTTGVQAADIRARGNLLSSFGQIGSSFAAGSA